MRYISAIALTVVIVGSASSAAERDWPLKWHYMIVMPDDQQNWTLDQGIAQVEIHGQNFSASMDNGDVILKGTITGNKITAIETLIGTDANPMTLHGDFERARTLLTDASNGWGSDRISLYASGGVYIGLFRRVRSGAPPGESGPK